MSEQTEPLLSLAQVLEAERKLEIQKAFALESAFKGNDVEQYYQAQSYLKKINEREITPGKSMLVDPLDLTSSFGYKNKAYSISYDVLRAMSRTWISKAIIGTRKEQVLAFCEPQKDKYSTGFVVLKRSKFTEIKKEVKLKKEEEKKIEYLINFILSCGTSENFWHGDTFDDFIGKIVQDSLAMDQATFEIVRNRKGEPIEFFATDAATFRIADTYNDDEDNTKHPDKIVQGYAPSYVQLYMGEVTQEFYPWELCFGVRNPQSDLHMNGYGRGEQEDMIQTITALLNSDLYNANFFKVGAAPKGILRYSGNVNQNTIDDFRRQWIAQVAGALNAHKVPVINADKMDFINTHVPNKDMEFSKYQEFLIKVACAMYKIDPSEIGFPMSGNTNGTQGLGGDSTEEKLEFSRDKGLKPLLKKIQQWLNKYIIWQLDPEYELRFVGIEGDSDEQTDLDRDIELVTNIETLNEIRAKRNKKPLEFGDIPLNPVILQMMQMKQQQQQQEQQMGMQKDQMEYDRQGQEEEERQENANENPFGGNDEQGKEPEEDPFMKSLSADLEKLLTEETV